MLQPPARAGKPLTSSGQKPRLLVEGWNPDRTVTDLRDILADAPGLFDRGVVVRVTFDQTDGGTSAQVIKPPLLVYLAHNVCRPYRIDDDGEEKDARLPHWAAVTYLELRGEWGLPTLNGITSAPLLQEDGTLRSASGYDAVSGMWCENVPDLTGREAFKTFCFADAETTHVKGISVVDTNKPPGRDESAFLVALLTAVCRPSLRLAPGVVLRAPSLSGA